MIALDVERSGGRGNVAQVEIRRTLFDVVRGAFDDSGLDWLAGTRKDLGDGVRVILPAHSPRSAVVYPLAHRLAVRLRDHNRLAGTATTIRLRVALHAGDVLTTADGQAGRSLEFLARLLDSDVLRRALSDAPESTTLALLVSGHMYEEVVQHGYPGIDPATFRRVSVQVKETCVDAWLYLPNAVLGPPAVPEPPRAAAKPSQASDTQTNSATGRGTVFAVQSGTQTIHQKDS